MQTSFPTENLINCVLNTRRYILQATKTHQISVHNARQEWNFFDRTKEQQPMMPVLTNHQSLLKWKTLRRILCKSFIGMKNYLKCHNIFWITHNAWVQSLILILISIFHEINTGLKRVDWYFTIKHVSQFDLRVEFNSIGDNSGQSWADT